MSHLPAILQLAVEIGLAGLIILVLFLAAGFIVLTLVAKAMNREEGQ